MHFGHSRLLSTVVGLSLLVGGFAMQTGQCQEETGSRKMLHLFSLDFPPDMISRFPIPAIAETRFWQLMDREIKATPDLALTENMENADYRVEVRCAGFFRCSALAVDIKDLKRNVLSSFMLKNIAPAWGLWKPDLDKVSRQLTIRLDEQIKLLDQGGYGYSE